MMEEGRRMRGVVDSARRRMIAVVPRDARRVHGTVHQDREGHDDGVGTRQRRRSLEAPHLLECGAMGHFF